MKSKKWDAGFTLVEILVVFAVLSIIAATSIPTCLGFLTKSNDKICEVNRNRLKKMIATEMGYTDISFDKDENISIADPTQSRFDAYKCPSGGDVTYRITSDGKIVIRCSEHGVTSDIAEAWTQDTMNRVLDAFSGLTATTIDSTAVNGASRNQLIANLKDIGLDLEAMGATSWVYNKASDGTRFEWSTADVASLPVGTSVPVIRLRDNGVYSVWYATVQTNSSGIHILKVGMSGSNEYSESKAIDMETKKDIDVMKEIYNNMASSMGYDTLK